MDRVKGIVLHLLALLQEAVILGIGAGLALFLAMWAMRKAGLW